MLLEIDNPAVADYLTHKAVANIRVRYFSVTHYAEGNCVVRVVTAHHDGDFIGCGREVERKVRRDCPDHETAQLQAAMLDGNLTDYVARRIAFLGHATDHKGEPLMECLPSAVSPRPLVY